MKSVLIALTIGSVFTACGSKTDADKNLTGPGSSVSYNGNASPDSSGSAPLQENKRVVVVETRNANGSSTITTTTEPVVKHDTVTIQPAVVTATPVSTAPAKAATVKKKGWSSRAKGAAIGGVGGAAVGAAVSKKKVQGAILGGAIGAGGGYIIGNEIHKKPNR